MTLLDDRCLLRVDPAHRGAPSVPSSTLAPLNSPSLAGLACEGSATARVRLRLVTEPSEVLPPAALLDQPSAVADFFWQLLGEEPQEVMAAAYLDYEYRLIGWQEVFRGTADRLKVEPRPILQAALLVNAHRIVLCHNHPSGDSTPSHEDELFTDRMLEASRIVGIRLVDHIVVGRGGAWSSLKRRMNWSGAI